MKLYLKALVVIALLASSLSAELVTTYFKTGELKAKTHYIDGTNTPIKVGIKNGLEKVYYQMGQLAYQVNYRNNKRDGLLVWHNKEGLEKWYDNSGKIIRTELFKHDIPVNVMKKIEAKKRERNILIHNINFSPKKMQ